MKKLTGKCLCGEIAYEINGEVGPIVNCHCSVCRRWHGAAFRSRCTVASKDFTWLRGEQYLEKYERPSQDIMTFCKLCGSKLVTLYQDDPEHIGLPIGGLEQDSGKRPEANIYAASKAPWYDINDGLPCYDELPDYDIDSVPEDN